MPEDSSATVISDKLSKSQEEIHSNEDIPIVGKTSPQNLQEHESSEKITISMLLVGFLMGFNEFIYFMKFCYGRNF